MIRWLWEHRVTLVPVWVVLATLAGGLLSRFALAELPWWQVGGLAVVVVAPVAAWVFRIKKPWRRRWALALCAGAVAWLTAAHGTLPPATLGLWLLLGGVALTVGRLANMSLGERVEMEGELRDWSEAAKRIGMPELTWTGTRIIPGQGWTAKLTWPRGAYDIDAVRKNIHRIEGARDLPSGSLRLIPRGRSHNTMDAIYLAADPTAGQVIEWPGPVKTDGYSAADPVPMGEHEDGSTVSVQRFRPGKGERRILVGGASESGKSGVINNFVGEDACRDDVVGLGMDLKGGVELGPWSDVLLWMIHDIDGAIEMLAALEAAAVYRQAQMREVYKVRVWPLSPALPAIHINVDEIRKLAGSTVGRSGKQQRVLLDQLIDVATQGRAVGIGLLCAGQHLTLEALGTSQVRTQFDIRVGLRMNEEESSRYVFPDDPGLRLHKIPAEMPGTAHLKDGDKLDPLPHRGYFWSDELVAEVAALRAGGGALLDQGTGDAMAAASGMFAEIWAKVRGGDDAASPVDLVKAEDGESGGEPRGDVPAPETFAAGDDVALADVVARNRARTAVAGAVEPTPLRQKPRERLTDDQAKVAMRELLREAGPEGCSGAELRGAATRASTWFHTVINAWIDDEGSVVRTGRGRYADARVTAGAASGGHGE